VRGAIEALGAERIMHGVRSVEDPALVSELVESGLPLAVCLHSNLLLGVCGSLEEHPIRELWDAGVNLSVNTDDPGFFHADIVDVSLDTVTVEVTGDEAKIDALVQLLKNFGIKEMARTGRVALTRGASGTSTDEEQPVPMRRVVPPNRRIVASQ